MEYFKSAHLPLQMQPELGALRQFFLGILWLGGDESSRSPLFQSVPTTSDKSLPLVYASPGMLIS